MATGFRKSLSIFQGGQVDYYSARDLEDNQFQEITNTDLHVPGRIKRPESTLTITSDTANNYYEMRTVGTGFSILNSEYAYGDSLLASVDITHVKGYSASVTGQNTKNFSLGRDLTVTTTSAHGFVIGDYIEITRDGGAADSEFTNLTGVYQILRVDSTTTCVIFCANLETVGIPETANESVSNLNVRKIHQNNPTVYGILPVEIGFAAPSSRYYSEGGVVPTKGERALMMSVLDGAAITFSIDEGTAGNGIYFLPALFWQTNYPLATWTHFDHVIWVGGSFSAQGFKVGQTITYTSTGNNGDTLNNNKSGTILWVSDEGIRLSTIDNVVNTQGSYSSGTFTASAVGWQDTKIDSWDDSFPIKVSSYTLAGAIRLCDTNFDNINHVNKWFGLIKGPRYGEAVDYSRSPRSISSRPLNAVMKHNWNMISQSIPAPTMIKMDGCFDPTYKVKNAGEVGLHIYDPYKFKEVNNSFQEHVLYPEAIVKETFSSEDRWATTFIYDGASESELSRDADGSIGVGGFETISPGDILEEPITYLTAEDIESVVSVVSYSNTLNPKASRENILINLTSETDGSAGAHKKLSIGDIIRIGSEKLCIVNVGTHSSTNAFVEFIVHRGVLGTSPIDLTDLEVSYVDQNQKARAINVVLGVGNNTPASVAYIQSGAKIIVTAAKSLGALANQRLVLDIAYTASGSGDSTIIVTKEVVNSGEAHYLRLNVTCQKKASNAIAFEDIVAAINNDTVVSSNVAITQKNPINQYCSAALVDGVTGSGEATTNQGEKYFGDTALASSADGINVDGLNQRITGFNLYWKPKDEIDWYLVQYYDIEKGWSNI